MNKEKQIEEMAKVIASVPPREIPIGSRKQGRHIYIATKIAEHLYNANFRKQSEGEWIDSLKGYCQCSICRTSFETLPTTFLFKLNNSFCRNCGALMKGGRNDG